MDHWNFSHYFILVVLGCIAAHYARLAALTSLKKRKEKREKDAKLWKLSKPGTYETYAEMRLRIYSQKYSRNYLEEELKKYDIDELHREVRSRVNRLSYNERMRYVY